LDPNNNLKTESFLSQLIASCEQRPEKVAMRVVGDESEVYTYGEMLRQIRSVAYRLGQENVGFGDRVALIGENHPSWAVAYLATLYHGAVCVPLDPHGEIETITNFLENSEARLAFLSPDITPKFQQIEEKLERHIPAVVWHLENSSNGFQRFDEWSETDFPESFASEAPKAAGDDNALLIYTSGTTGMPKGVPLTHGNIAAELSGVNAVLKLSDKESILSLLPLFHAYLQIVNLWVAATYGCEVGYLKELTPSELEKAMKEFRMSMLTTVPRLWYLFHKKITDTVAAQPKAVRILFRAMLATNGFFRDHLNINLGKVLFKKVHASFGGNLKLAISAGSRFDEKVAVDFHRLGFTIIQGYGLTETSGAATATHETDNRVGSVGKPMSGAEIKIDQPDKDGVGEVLIRGPIVFKGYYNNPTATAEAFNGDGWFRSGDLGTLDQEGHLYIVGRKKDVIVLPSGKNVHPEDLEVHYLKTPLVEELAILGVKDTSSAHAGAEKLVAVAVPDFQYLKLNRIANSQNAIRYALDNLGRELPEYQRVRDYVVRVEPLPRTATRKIKRFELQKEIENGTRAAGEARAAKVWKLSAEDKALLDSGAGRTTISVIRKNSGAADEVHPDMNLEIDLGLDSLGRAEVFAAIEQAYSVEFEAEEAAQSLTVRDTVALISKYAGEAAQTEAVSADLNWSRIVREAEPSDLPELAGLLEKRPLFSPFIFSVYKTFNLFCKGFMRLEVENIEYLREMKRPFLICPNHQSFLDPFVLCSNYPYDVFKNTFHVGASEFFKSGLMSYVAKLLNIVPVDPDTQLMRAMKAGAIGLKNGKVLNIYPEGERAFDGELHEFKKGAAIQAVELDLPIVPVALDGVWKVWARRSWKIRPAKVKIRFGKPFYAKDIVSAESDAEAKYTAVTAHLRATIAGMIEEMRK
jgi:long-chain acyl-CoA synthetase